MVFPGSRYEHTGSYTVALPDGRTVRALRLPAPRVTGLRGYHRRLDGQRLDLIANFHLKDPNGFWKLCDAAGAVVPDALAARVLIAIPDKA